MHTSVDLLGFLQPQLVLGGRPGQAIVFNPKFKKREREKKEEDLCFVLGCFHQCCSVTPWGPRPFRVKQPLILVFLSSSVLLLSKNCKSILAPGYLPYYPRLMVFFHSQPMGMLSLPMLQFFPLSCDTLGPLLEPSAPFYHL